MNMSSGGTLYIPLWSGIPSNYCQFHMQNRFTLTLFFCCCCSVTQSCQNYCDPMDYRAQGFYILHCFLESAQTHVLQSAMPSDYLNLCHPLLLPSIFPSIGSFPMSQLFISGDQRIEASSSAPVIPMNVQG